MKKHNGGFIPEKARTTLGGNSSNITPRGRKPGNTWRGESDREESLSDPRWYIKTHTTMYKRWTTQSTTTSEYCVSRADPQQVGTELPSPNNASPAMSTSQVKLSHELIMTSVVESSDNASTTEIEEDTPLYRKMLQQVMGSNLLPQLPEKTRTLNRL